MSYVDAYYEKDKDIVHIVERDTDGVRHYREFQASYVFYYEDPNGNYQSMSGKPLSRVKSKSNKEHHKNIAIFGQTKKLYESDINVTFRCLEDHYLNADAPKLNVAYFDIETSMCPIRGYSSPAEAFMPIVSIAVYLQWSETMICLAIPPKNMSIAEAESHVVDFENTFIFKTEKELLNTFLTIIEDADILSGWNSEAYDIPYTVNRVAKVLSKNDTRRFCLWDQLPKKREYEKYGKIETTYDLVGRVHMDSLDVYRKFTYEERPTYRLDAIAEFELGDHKTPYDGTLEQLYNQDFKKFIEYNRQDVALLDRMDKKLKFIDLANTLAHECTVNLPATLGSVAMIEQAIINETHNRKMIASNRKPKSDVESNQAAGAYVAYPKKGLHDWIASLDINSLYPSAIRALNMSPETIIGQVRQDATDKFINDQMAGGKKFAQCWEGVFAALEYDDIMSKNSSRMITIDWSEGSSDTLSAAQAHELIFNSNQSWMISANGTIFTYEVEGVIPGLLKRWYSERQDMQKRLKTAIEGGNTVEEHFWDKRQLVKKIVLNSLYGALLNSGCRFFDKRIGQSTTLTGRSIVKHMTSQVNKIICDDYNYVGETIIYGDTDSVYFSAYETLKPEIDAGIIPWDKESIIQFYDAIGSEVNDSFPKFMSDSFHCPKNRGSVIKAGREIVASKALFITKKRYAALYFDKEGKRSDVNGKSGKIKAMGLDLRRSDTPPAIQDFLSEVLYMVLNDKPKDDIIQYISDFRVAFKKWNGWEKGSPKRANNITKYGTMLDKKGKTGMPGQVRASLNWNILKRMNSDMYSMQIVDGAKVIVCTLKSNPMDFKSVAYPVDEQRLPQWFKELPFDDAAMEYKLIDDKLDNLIGVLDWDLSGTRQDNFFNTLFTF
jgi:DNA polymerase elongation subunit (family B)